MWEAIFYYNNVLVLSWRELEKGIVATRPKERQGPRSRSVDRLLILVQARERARGTTDRLQHPRPDPKTSLPSALKRDIIMFYLPSSPTFLRHTIFFNWKYINNSRIENFIKWITIKKFTFYTKALPHKLYLHYREIFCKNLATRVLSRNSDKHWRTVHRVFALSLDNQQYITHYN